MNAVILLLIYHRNPLLEAGLASIAKQGVQIEIWVLDEGEKGDAQQIAERFDARYLWTARTKPRPDYWRVPGFAINVAAKRTSADLLILSCPEIYHVQNDTLARLVRPLEGDPEYRGICTCDGRDDKGAYSRALRENAGDPIALEAAWNECPPLRMELPFLMAMRRQEFVSIGGYDEDFTGQSFDDDDLVNRLRDNGCALHKTDAQCVHLLHQRNDPSRMEAGRLEHNEKLYRERRGQIVRNVGSDWGAWPDG